MKVKIKVADPKLTPIKREGDACMDLFVDTVEIVEDEFKIRHAIVNTGVCVEFPPGYSGELYARSSVATKGYGWILANGVGVIDNSYRGEIKAVFRIAQHARQFPYKHGDRCVQLKIVKDYNFDIEIVNELSETDRGDGGFGSTGK